MHHGAMKFLRCLTLAAMLCIWALVGTVQAITYDLTAQVFTKTMPDGQVVTMWGYADNAAPLPIADQFPLVLDVPPGENLTINLTNNLPEFTSLQLSGLVDDNQTPVLLPLSNPPRYRSFTREADANGGTASYTWIIDRPGTFLLQSASHVSAQVPMGLYAVVKRNAGAGDAYGNGTTAYNREITFLFSEIDPALNAAVGGDPVTGAPPTLGTPDYPSTIHFEPKYFLVNGAPFPFGETHTYAGDVGLNTLVRFVNAGLLTRTPAIVGGHWRVIAEDGFPYPNEKQQFSLDLTAGKTLDIIGTSPVQGYSPIYDRSLGTTNADASTGGMFTYLEFGPDHLTPGGQAFLTIAKTGAGTGTVQSASLPGGIICATNSPVGTPAPPIGCSNHYLLNTELRLTAIPAPDSVFAGWTGCTPLPGLNDCLVTLTADTGVTASFIKIDTRVGVFTTVAQWYLDKGDTGWQSLAVDGHYPNFGSAGDLPVTGDMNGDGFSEVGVYHPASGAWYFDLDGNGAWSGCGLDLCLAQFGIPSDVPVTGDWDGDGRSEVGVYRNGQWYFDMDGSGTWSAANDVFKQNFGGPGHTPVTGDWNGDGTTEIGTYFQGTWYLDNGNGRWDGAGIDTVYQNFGATGHIPVTGDWDSDGTTQVGTFYQGAWYLDNGNGQWDEGIDLVIPNFGSPGDKPVTGTWR